MEREKGEKKEHAPFWREGEWRWVARTKSIKRTIPRERARNRLGEGTFAGQLFSSSFPLPFFSLLFLSPPVIYSRRSYFLPDALLSRDNSILHPLMYMYINIYTYISPLVTRIKGLTRRANFLPSMRNLYAKIILIFISTRVTDSFYYRWNSR